MEKLILVVMILAIIFIRKYLNYNIKLLNKQKKRNEILLKFYKENQHKSKKYHYEKMLEKCKDDIEKAKIINRIVFIVLVITYIIVFILVGRDDIFKIP